MEEEPYVRKPRRAALVRANPDAICGTVVLMRLGIRIRCMRCWRLLSRWLRPAQLLFAQLVHPGSDLQECRLRTVIPRRHHIKSKVSGGRVPDELGVKWNAEDFRGSVTAHPLAGWRKLFGNTAGQRVISMVWENIGLDEVKSRNGSGHRFHPTIGREG